MKSENPEQFADSQTDAIRGLRTLEERYNNLVRRVQLIEQNSINASKKANSENKLFNSDLADVKKQLSELNDRIIQIIRELETLAKKEDVDVLKKYLDLWEPVNFVTQSEVEKIVKRAIEDNNDKV